MRKIVIALSLSLMLSAGGVSYKISSLIAYAQENQNDIKSRELLLEYFYKHRDKKMLVKYSKELYSIDPRNKVLKKVVSDFSIMDRQEKIAKVLKNFFDEKHYVRYLNFYNALIDIHENVDNNFHLKAIYSAIKIDKYDLAEQILKREKLPITPFLGKVMAMLDKKLDSDKSL